MIPPFYLKGPGGMVPGQAPVSPDCPFFPGLSDEVVPMRLEVRVLKEDAHRNRSSV